MLFSSLPRPPAESGDSNVCGAVEARRFLRASFAIASFTMRSSLVRYSSSDFDSSDSVYKIRSINVLLSVPNKLDPCGAFSRRICGRRDVWMRVDRRRSRSTSTPIFLLRGGRTEANDVVSSSCLLYAMEMTHRVVVGLALKHQRSPPRAAARHSREQYQFQVTSPPRRLSILLAGHL